MRPGGRLETSKRSADEQGQALREAQDKAEKLAAELAAGPTGSPVPGVRWRVSARDKLAGVKEAAERSADEQRHALQQERDKTEKLAAELAEAKSSLETQAKAKAAEEVARDNQLAAMRSELQKAKAEATVARESLEAERTRTQRAEQQLGVNSGKHGGSQQPLAVGSVVYRRSTLNCSSLRRRKHRRRPTGAAPEPAQPASRSPDRARQPAAGAGQYRRRAEHARPGGGDGQHRGPVLAGGDIRSIAPVGAANLRHAE